MRASLLATALLLLTAAAGAQEGDEIDALVADLASPDFDVRVRATEALAALGQAARPALERAAASEDPETASRAAALLAVLRQDDVIAGAFGAGRPIDLALEAATLGEAAAALSAASGRTIAVDADLAATPVDLTAAGATLLEILDDLCRRTPGVDWTFDGDALRLRAGRFVEVPTAHAGALRLRVLGVETRTRNDFRDRTTSIELALAVDGERGPVAIEGLEVTEILGADGEPLAWEPRPTRAAGGGFSRMTINGRTIEVFEAGGELQIVHRTDDGPGRERVDLLAIPGPVEATGGLRATVRLRVREGAAEIAFDGLAAGDFGQAAGIGARVAGLDEGTVVVVLTGEAGRDPATLAPDAVRLVTADGEVDVEPLDPSSARRHLMRNFRELRDLVRGRNEGHLLVLPIPEGATVTGLEISVTRNLIHEVEFEVPGFGLR